jgi:hypothetical protein
MHTPASLKAEHKTLSAAKAVYTIKAASWKALADKLNGTDKPTKKPQSVAELKSTVKNLQQRIQQLEAEIVALQQPSTAAKGTDSDYFISPEAEIIYSIIKLDGESRLKALGVNRTHYRDAKKAKEWRNNLAMKVHPDKCFHPLADQAIDEITAIYKNMVAA